MSRECVCELDSVGTFDFMGVLISRASLALFSRIAPDDVSSLLPHKWSSRLTFEQTMSAIQ